MLIICLARGHVVRSTAFMASKKTWQSALYVSLHETCTAIPALLALSSSKSTSHTIACTAAAAMWRWPSQIFESPLRRTKANLDLNLHTWPLPPSLDRCDAWALVYPGLFAAAGVVALPQYRLKETQRGAQDLAERSGASKRGDRQRATAVEGRRLRAWRNQTACRPVRGIRANRNRMM